MECIDCDEIKLMNSALNRCDDVSRILWLSLLQVQALQIKYGAWQEINDETDVTDWCLPTSRSAPTIPVASRTMLCNESDTLRRPRSLLHINKSSNSLAVQLMKIRRSISVIHLHVERLLIKYRRSDHFNQSHTKRRKNLYYMPSMARGRHSHCFDSPQWANADAALSQCHAITLTDRNHQ